MSPLENMRIWILTTICGLGFVGNILSLIVWSLLVHKVKGSRFFIALCLSDLLTIVFGLIGELLQLLEKHCVRDVVLSFLCEFFYYLSAHITVAIVMQWLLSVARPFSVKRLCSEVRQTATIVALLLLTAVEVTVVYFAYRFEFCVLWNINDQVHVISACLHAALNLALSALLVVLNVILVCKLKQMQTAAAASVESRNRDSLKRKLSIMALWTSSITVIASVLVLIRNIYVIIGVKGGNFTQSEGTIVRHVSLAAEIARACNVSVNVVWYCVLCEAFRGVITRACLRLATGGPRAQPV